MKMAAGTKLVWTHSISNNLLLEEPATLNFESETDQTVFSIKLDNPILIGPNKMAGHILEVPASEVKFERLIKITMTIKCNTDELFMSEETKAIGGALYERLKPDLEPEFTLKSCVTEFYDGKTSGALEVMNNES